MAKRKRKTASRTAGTAAADRLRALEIDDEFKGSVNRHRNLVKDLQTVRDQLTAAEIRRLVAAVVDFSPRLLIEAARKPIHDPLRNQILKQLRKCSNLGPQFFVNADKRGAATEAADLLFEFNRSCDFRELTKRLKRRDASAEAVAAAMTTLGKTPTRDWLDQFFELHGLIGLLARDSSDRAIAVIGKVARPLAVFAESERVLNPNELIATSLKTFSRGPKANSLTNKLQSLEHRRREHCSAQALAEGLRLSFAGKQNWSVSIWLSNGAPKPYFGLGQRGPQLHLQLDPTQKPDWKVTIVGEGKNGRYTNWGGKVTQDDFGLSSLASLDDFPAWLRSAEGTLQLQFSIENAVIDCGRHKKAAEPLRAWLNNADST